jgi:hypothetical protein
MRKRLDYHQARDGEWFRITKRGFKDACCHCGLVHVVNFRTNPDGTLEMQATIDRRATAAMRRNKMKATT